MASTRTPARRGAATLALVSAALLAAALGGCARSGAGAQHPARAVAPGTTSAPGPGPGGSGSGSAGSGSGGATAGGGRAAGPVAGLHDVQFVSSRAGWAVGPGAILATTDGGRSWLRQYRGPAQLDRVDFVSSSTGWALGPGALLGTRDGGRSWQRLGEPAVPLAQVHFASPTAGWGVSARPESPAGGAAPGTLVRTVDGGRTWQAQAAPGPLYAACFTTPSLGWAGGAGRVWRSVDGGRSWALSFRQPPNGAVGPDPRWRTTVSCAGQAGAWVLFDSDEGDAGTSPWVVYATADARHWRPVVADRQGAPVFGAADGPGSYSGPMSAVSHAVAWLAGYTPAAAGDYFRLVLASDGGARVGPSLRGPRVTISEPFAISFVDERHGWAVGTSPGGSHGTVWVTVDGGRHWSQQFRG